MLTFSRNQHKRVNTKIFIMKTIMNLSMLTVLVLVGFLFIGCEGPEGPVGQDGDTGLQGPQGEQGVQGDAGEDGQDGNANVTTVSFDISEEFGVTFIDLSVPELTAEFIENHVILGYVSSTATAGVERWYQLPSQASFVPFHIAFSYLLTLVSLDFFDPSDYSSYTLLEGQLDELRLVFIEISDPSAKSQNSVLEDLEAAGVDVRNYEEVAAYFGLENK